MKRVPDTSPPSVEQWEWLAQLDWEDLYPRILFWARRIHERYLSGVALALEPWDLVQEAIDALFTGRRTLQYPVTVSPITVFKRIMESIALNEKEKHGNVHLPFEEERGPATAAPDLVCKDALRVVEGDEVLEKIVALLCKDAGMKARDLAATLGISIERIYNATKRMRRKLGPYLREG